MKVRGDVLAACVLALAVVAGGVAVWRLSPTKDRIGDTDTLGTRHTTRTLQALEASPSVELTGTGLAEMVVETAQPRQASPLEPAAFSADRALDTVRNLEALGPRGGGSDAEKRAAEYLRDRLVQLGLDAGIEEFALPDGAISRNVVARIVGSTDTLVVLGAHMDTKPPSPGANDNASGCGALVEIARLLAADPPLPTVEIVFFGSEETLGSDPDVHHLGSRYRVSQMSATERGQTAGMISIDMIGYGTDFHSRTMGRGPRTLSDALLARARALGIGMTYLRDPGSSGWSDHEAYELAGIPSVWLEWRDDPAYHTTEDTVERLSSAKIASAGRLVLEFVRGLDASSLPQLTGR